MHTLPEDEARALLSGPLLLADAPEWSSDRTRPWETSIGCGLLDVDGNSAGLTVQLQVVMRSRTGGRTFQFTIFRARLHGLQRAYQLTIQRFGRRVPNWHQLSHEHFGTQRLELPDDAEHWTFEQALSYFCERTNLRIEPPINDPQELHLRP